MTNYFKDCTTINDVKARYRDLAKQHHPDRGGDTATMQAINLQYTQAIKAAAKGANLSDEEAEAEVLNGEQYKTALNAILNLQGLIIELCGGWLWVSGDTRTHKDVLKSAGFYFASKKVMWYFRSAEYKTKNKKALPIEAIRAKYGSQQIASQYKEREQIRG